MATRYRRPSVLKRLIPSAVAIAAVAYFAHQAQLGNYGTAARARLDAQRAELRAQLAGLTAEREALELKVSRLRPPDVDADLLDERARAQLTLAKPDEVVVYLESPLAVAR